MHVTENGEIVLFLNSFCLTKSKLHFSTLTEPFNYSSIAFYNTRRIIDSLVTVIVTHTDAAIIILPLTTLIRLVVPSPRVKA